MSRYAGLLIFLALALTPGAAAGRGMGAGGNMAAGRGGAGSPSAATCVSTGSGVWSGIAWTCGHLPWDNDSVLIAVADTVTLNVDSRPLRSVTVGGTLLLGKSTRPVTLTLTTDTGQTPALLAITPTGQLKMGYPDVAHRINFAGGNSGQMNWTNDGTFMPGSSTVTFTGTDHAVGVIGGSKASQAFHNLTVAGPGTALNVAANVTALTVDGDLSLGETETTFSAPAALDLGGNLIAGGAFNANGGTVRFNGGRTQQISQGATANRLTFNNLTVAAGTTVQLPGEPAAEPAVSGAVANQGTLVQSKSLTQGAGNEFLGLGGKYHGAAITAGQAVTGVTVAVRGEQTCPAADLWSVRRCYDIAFTDPISASVRFYFSQVDLPAGMAPRQLQVWRLADGKWSLLPRGGDSGACAAGAVDCYVEAADVAAGGTFAVRGRWYAWLPLLQQ